MSYYDLPWDWRNGQVLFVLKDNGSRVLRKVFGRTCGKGFEPSITGETQSYPSFNAILVRGEVELIEHKAMEPVFYVTDDAVAQQHFRMLGCF